MTKLYDHFNYMTGLACAYITPEPYVDLRGMRHDDNSAGKKEAFIHDMIYMLDGPEQREACEADSTRRVLSDLAVAIRQWAEARNLIEGATSQAQTVKLFEEGGEVAHAVARGDREALKDGIGDMVVVLTILAAQNSLTLEECVAAAYDEIKDRTGRMVDGVFIKDET